jgi:hypothetical protein
VRKVNRPHIFFNPSQQDLLAATRPYRKSLAQYVYYVLYTVSKITLSGLFWSDIRHGWIGLGNLQRSAFD